MKKFSRVFSLVLLSTFFFTTVAPPALACGPSFTVPVFQFNSRSDSFEDYARGELGIVKPYFNRSFLFVAYRYFNNQPLTAREQKDVIDVWRAQYDRDEVSERDTNAAVKLWTTARKRVLPGEPEPKIYTESNYGGGYNFFPNCTKNAFETAAATLNDRAAKHGAADPNVQNWTRAQDQVFNNCSEGKNEPNAADATAPEWLKNDRAYQIAAANFYATNLDQALAQFEAIAANPNSAWRNTASYLVARTLIRQASFENNEYYNVEEDKRKAIEARVAELYRRAEAQLNKISKDQSQADFHEPARKLLNLIAFRTRSHERQHELADALVRPQENPNLRLDLIDYTWLLDKNTAAAKESAEKAAQQTAEKAGAEYNYNYRLKATDLSAETRGDDLTDWIFTVQTVNDPATARHALDKWQQTNQPHWFVAALASADKNSAQLDKLLQAAERVDKSSAMFATAAFHQVRLLTENGKSVEARQKLDRLLADKSVRLSTSARNNFLAQRTVLAETLDDFLQFAQRRSAAFAVDGSPYLIEDVTKKPAGSDEDYYKDERLWASRTMFDEDATQIFNRQMPLQVLKQAATSSRLPDYLKRNLLVAAWTRAVLLGDDATAQELAVNFPKLAPEFSSIFAQYANAATVAEREQAATFVLLKFPALRPLVESGYGRLTPVAEIDSYRDNWWCRDSFYAAPDSSAAQEFDRLPAPQFLSAEQIAAARRETAQMAKLGNSSTVLARRAVDFAAKAPQDKRVPEALHLAVRATRYGCTDCATGRFSRAAHDSLKKNFPTSEFTKKTPYWFKDESCETQK